MKNNIIFLAALSIFSAKAQLNTKNLSLGSSALEITDSLSILGSTTFTNMEKRYTYKNLRLYMLRGNAEIRSANRQLGNYLNLEKAIAQKKLIVTELGSGEVNQLQFENVSNDTIMLLAGEVVTGGKQDRVISNDALLPPKSGKVRLAVFCVEHGRWSANGSGNQFNGYFGISNTTVRKNAVVDKDQSRVWSKVAEVNSKGKTGSSTGTLTAINNSEILVKELPEYVAYFESLVNADSNFLGFVAVSADTIIGCDLFASNQMFKSHASQLLKSVAIEAITNGSEVTITGQRVTSFLQEFLKDENEQDDKVNENGTLLKNKGKNLHINYYPKNK